MESVPACRAASSFSFSRSIEQHSPLVPRLALTLVFSPLPIALRLGKEWFTFLGKTASPAAIRSRSCSAETGSFSTAFFISSVIMPVRADSSCVAITSSWSGSVEYPEDELRYRELPENDKEPSWRRTALQKTIFSRFLRQH